jgi:Flp pilus assembly pilin Flp
MRGRVNLSDQRAQTFVEYALVLVMIVGLVLVGWTALTGALQTAVTAVITAF